MTTQAIKLAEKHREYHYPNGSILVIKNPLELIVLSTFEHLLTNFWGIYEIPAGWTELHVTDLEDNVSVIPKTH